MHQGFLSQFKLLEPLLDRYVLSHLRANRRHRLLCCGHSLGGAVAAVAAVVYGCMYPGQVEWVSFGAPKIGNGAFAEALRRKARVISSLLSPRRLAHLARTHAPEPFMLCRIFFLPQVGLRWRVKHGRDLVVKVPAGDFAGCGTELHCGRDDPYPDIPVFQDLPDHDSIRYIEALDALAVRVSKEGDIMAFPLNVVGALNPARGLALMMNELFKAWQYWSGVGANIVGMGSLQGSPEKGGAREAMSAGSDFFEPELAHAYTQAQARAGRASGSVRGGAGEVGGGVGGQPRTSGGSFAGSLSFGGRAGGGGEGSVRAASTTGGPAAASGSRRSFSSLRNELPPQPPQPPAWRASNGSRLSRANSLTGGGGGGDPPPVSRAPSPR